jgi:predicted DNA-binding protein
MPFSLRLDAETERKIRRLARATGRSRSAVVREAMAQYELDRRDQDGASAPSALDRIRPFVGIVGTGGAHYSAETHHKYRAKLARAVRGQRSR